MQRLERREGTTHKVVLHMNVVIVVEEQMVRDCVEQSIETCMKLREGIFQSPAHFSQDSCYLDGRISRQDDESCNADLSNGI